MARSWRKLALLAKIQPATADAAPTGAANAIQALDVTLTPLAGEEVQRGYIQPYLGHQGSVLVGDYVELAFSVELAGSGTAGTAPALGPLLRGCGMAEVVTAGVSVAYNPISAAYEMLTIHCIVDGVRHVLLGARGTWTMTLTPKQIPKIALTFRGLFAPLSDIANPAVTLTAWQRALPVNKATTPVTFFGLTSPLESLSIDLGNTVTVRNLINYEGVEITDRQATGSAVVEAVSVAAKDWIALARAGTAGALAVQHGSTAGNIVELAAPVLQLGRPTLGQTDNIVNNTLPLMVRPAAGNDELVLTFR